MFVEPREIERILREVVNRFLIPKFSELGMNATGEWLQNLEVHAGEDSGTIRGRQYSEWLAKGAGPHIAPVKPLQRWAMAKFGVDDQKGLSIAFAVREKIKKLGTSWYEQGGSDLIEVLESPEVRDFINSELSAILRVMLAEQLIRNASEFENYLATL